MTPVTSTERLDVLEPLVRTAAVSDPAFAAALVNDPIAAVSARFGASMLPNEGEFTRRLSDGNLELVFPISGRNIVISAEDELSDELLDVVSGGAGAQPSTNKP